MKFKRLEWKDIISDGVIVTSNCMLKIYGYDIKIKFIIDHERKENVYYLYSFGGGSIRRSQADKYNTVDEAKAAAYEIYNHEMCLIKDSVDSFLSNDETTT